MKYSIIVPVYNVENYVIRCLESLKNQTYKGDYEVIIVDDGSTDNSKKLVEKYIKDLTNFKLYSKKNGGLSSARNYGIKKSTGKYLLFVDSDDYLDINTLKIIEDNSEENDIIVFDFYEDNEKEIKEVLTSDSSIEDNSKRYIVSLPSACNKAFSKELFNDIEFPIGLYYEDLGTIPKLAKKNNKIKFIDKPLYYYYKRENSIMNAIKYNKKMDSIFQVLKEIKEYYNGEHHEEIEYLYIHHLLRAASLRYIDCDCNCQEQLDQIILIMKKEYPKWSKNKYYKKLDFKKRIMCKLIYYKQYKLIKKLRK